MPHSLDDAKDLIYDTILHRQNGTAPEDTPVIFNESTIAKPWGWIFFYNNERFHQTRDISCQWVGPGPIFFNRNTGDIRQFGSGCDLDHELHDYENELAAADGSWCLWLSGSQDRAATIFKLKTAFALNTIAAKKMVPSLPCCLFSGKRTHLDWVATHLHNLGVATDITLEQSTDIAQNAFVLPEQMINPSLAQAYHQRWDV
jgi:hypothetical protein